MPKLLWLRLVPYLNLFWWRENRRPPFPDWLLDRWGVEGPSLFCTFLSLAGKIVGWGVSAGSARLSLAPELWMKVE